MIGEVGEAVELEYRGTTGAVCTVTLTDPAGVVVSNGPLVVDHTDGGVDVFIFAFIPTAPDTWTVHAVLSGPVQAVETEHVYAFEPAVPLATIGEYEQRHGPITDPAARDRAVWALQEVSSQIRHWTGRAYDRPPVWLRGAVLRVLREAYDRDPSLRSFVAGDYGETYAVAATGRVSMVPSWLVDMLPPRVGTFATVGGSGLSDTRWCGPLPEGQ